MKEVITGEITGLAFGGQGILRKDGLVVFVPFTAPEDIVACRITSKKKSYATAQIENILKPSPNRVEPKCPYFGACGGCQLQHLPYDLQLKHKGQCVTDALQRIGHIKAEDAFSTQPAMNQWAYRRHVTLTMMPSVNGYKIGYIGADNHSLIENNQCPIFLDSEDNLFINLKQAVSSLECPDNNKSKVTVFKYESGYLFNFQFAALPRNFSPVMENALQMNNNWKGILATTPGKTVEYGLIRPILEIDGMSFEFSPRAFIQNHPEQSLNIYKEISAMAKEAGASRALDLYCGIGISSLFLAREGLSVVGVENNAEAVKKASHNAKANHLTNTRFIASDVKDVLHDLLKVEKPDLVVVNPPRSGLDHQVAKNLALSDVKHVIYISCMPSTLARDLAILCKERYKLEICRPFDMFPQTAHVETVAYLKAER